MTSAIAKSVVSVEHGHAVCFSFGLFLAGRICITFLAFQSEPTMGTAVSIAVSCAFVFFAWAASDGRMIGEFRSVTARWLCTYLVFAALSLCWSETKSPAVALMYWVGLAADCVSVFMLASGDESSEACHAIMRGFVIGSAIVGLIAWTLPTLPDLRIGNEDFLHPNALGYLLGIATLFALNLSRHSQWMTIFAAGCGVTLLRTLSKASIAAFAAAVVLYLLRDSHMTRRAKMWIGIGAAVVIASSWGLLEAYASTYAQVNHVETLTGRTFIWAVAWEEALKSPWLGHGFYSFRFVIPAIGTFEPWQAHNELLQQFFCYGMIGVTIVVGLYWSFMRELRNARHRECATLAAAIMLFAVIRGLVDTERFDTNYPLWLLTLFILVLQAPRQAAR
jgi:exopolysaccharide production protein ExoQ